MRSSCYVVLPEELPVNSDAVHTFLRAQMDRYDIKRELEPYKRFFTCEETLNIAKRHGYQSVSAFENHLKEQGEEDGIENGRYYWLTTWNDHGEWDAFTLKAVKPCHELADGPPPYSVVTPDGQWHSKREYGYCPVKDFESMGRHPDNLEPEQFWEAYLEQSFFSLYRESKIAVLQIHS